MMPMTLAVPLDLPDVRMLAHRLLEPIAFRELLTI